MAKMKPAGTSSRPASRQTSPIRVEPKEEQKAQVNKIIDAISEDDDEERGTFA